MGQLEDEILATRKTRAGDANLRAYVGPPAQYDFMGATQFRLLAGLGLREEHRIVDIGCGSLRAGRYLISYLLPNRYTGIEPNSWLWQQALEREIGQDMARLKCPHFLADDDFQLAGIDNDSADFVVAQSIYSHTGVNLFEKSVNAVTRCLKESGQFLFTAVTSDDLNANAMMRGMSENGWFYPQCLVYTEEEVLSICRSADLFVQKLDWFHPRQTWFRATLDEKLALKPEMQVALGTGKPLFDPRFE